MMNLIKIRNLNNNRIRLYQLPEDCLINAGRMCRVPFAGETALGIATCDSWVEDDEGVTAIRKALNLSDDGEFKRVIACYTETLMIYDDDIKLPDDINEALDMLYEDPELDTACVESEEAEG